jgi:hypothetical protein
MKTCKHLNDETNETDGKAMISGLKNTDRSFYHLLQAVNEDER